MILHGIFAALTLLSLGLTLWQWRAGRRFPLHTRPWSAGFQPGKEADRLAAAPGARQRGLPPVTLLKPLKGADEFTEACLRSWLAQDYPGEVQVLFGVGDPGDPACAVVRKLMEECPPRDAQVIVCAERRGANAKVSKLAQLQALAKYDILVVSDADVRVPADLLTNLIPPLNHSLSMNLPLPERPSSCPLPTRCDGATARRVGWGEGGVPPGEGFRGSKRELSLRRNLSTPTPAGEKAAGTPGEGTPGLVNCFYRLANPATLAMRCEAVAINADFWSQVLQSRDLKPLDFALGAVMAVRREALEGIGGFAAFADHLADDYELGHRVARAGWRIELCPVVVDCCDPPKNWRQVWAHQLRWARTIRVCQPLPYFFSILSNATLWPLLWILSVFLGIQVAIGAGDLFLSLVPPGAVLLGGLSLGVRLLAAHDLQRRLTRGSDHVADGWLVPVKDLMQAAIWLLAFLGNRIDWRGERYRLRRDGRLERA